MVRLPPCTLLPRQPKVGLIVAPMDSVDPKPIFQAVNTEKSQDNNLSSTLNTKAVSFIVKLANGLLAHREAVTTLVTLAFIVAFTTLVLSAPNYEWDLFPYIANATNIVNPLPIGELHEYVYRNVQLSVPTEAYVKLINSPSRLVLSEDPEAFRQTIAFFYDARIVYIHIIAAAIKLGINPVFACYFFSIICAVASTLILAQLIPVKVPIGLYFVLPFIALSCGLLDVARLATPDSLATLVTITLYFLLFRNKVNLLLIILPFVIFIRTDLILLIALFQGYFLFFGRASKVGTLISGMATITAYLVLNKFLIDADPWSSLIGYNFGDKPTHPAEYAFDVTLSNYVTYLAKGLMSFSYTPIGFVYCMLTVTGVVLYSAKFFVHPEENTVSNLHADVLFLLVSCKLYLIMHFLMFPVTWTRFFAAQYSLAAVVVVWTTFSILAERNYSSRDDFDLLNGKERPD